MHDHKALILIDLQNDFCLGGSLAVPDAAEVIPIANQLQTQFKLVVATQDWHPMDHGSFAINHNNHQVGEEVELSGLRQILWPVHCVQHTAGAEFHPELQTDHIEKIFYKGTDPAIDSYSVFFDNGHRKATGLADYLRAHKITDVYIMGLATDYCVKYSVLDALLEGFKVFVVRDGCRGVELKAGDVERAWQEMQAAGAVLITGSDLTS